jgi:hypothetical protein
VILRAAMGKNQNIGGVAKMAAVMAPDPWRTSM